jgi:CheY-like chemotaxis protein/anti-sigma regulatory factor (Ser/Thr protein kinase)
MMRTMAEDRPPLERYRGVIERQVRTLTRLVDDLLDVSRLTRGTITLRRQASDLATLVRGAVEAARPLIDGGGHSLRVALPARSVPLFVDPTRFEQVLVNVLNNAAKYSERCGRIELTAEEHDGEAILRVKDHGAGIPADLLPRIFDLFVQGDRALERAQGGLGIGLTLVKSVVEMHGGRVEARSDGPGRGSEFVLRVPVAEDPAPLPAPDARRSAPPESAAPERRRVLVVDDNGDAAQMLVDLLTQWGHDVRHARRAGDALELAETFRPEAAIVGIGLPEEDGYEVARRLRHRGAPPPGGLVLIGVTEVGQEQDRSRARAAGFDHHLVKPADPETLRRLLVGQGAPG